MVNAEEDRIRPVIPWHSGDTSSPGGRLDIHHPGQRRGLRLGASMAVSSLRIEIPLDILER